MYPLRERAWLRWQAAAGVWRGWSVCLPLQVPDVDGVVPRTTALPSKAATIVDSLLGSLGERQTAVVLNLEPVTGIYVGAELNRRRVAHAVLVLPRWPYQEAVLPADELLGALISQSSALTTVSLRHVVFVLDGGREQSVRRRDGDLRADNRYRLFASDLPPLSALQRADIQRVVKVAYG